MPPRLRLSLYAAALLLLVGYGGAKAWEAIRPVVDPPRAGEELEEFLEPWYEAVEDHEEEPATVVVVGDSISEGVLLPTPVHRHRMVHLLQEQLRDAVGADGGEGFMPPYYGDLATRDDTVRGGTAAEEQMFGPWGLGGRALRMPGGAELTYPEQRASSVRVRYGRTALLGGQAKVFVDGEDLTAEGTLSTGEPSGPTLSSAGDEDEAGLWWTSPPLDGRTHVVQVRSLVSDADFIHTGVEFLDGDEESGIHVVDGSHSGVAAAHFATDEALAGHWQEVRSLDPDLVLVNLGTNPEPDHAGSLETLVRHALAAAPRARILLVDGYEPGTWSPERWQQVRDAKARVAEAHSDRVAVFDLAVHWPELEKDGSTNDGLMVEDALPLHPNDRGNELMASIYAELLTPPD